MQEGVINRAESRKKLWLGWLILVFGCTALNIGGARLASGLSLPIFLDCAGTILAGALGGFIPGIIVGFLTNLINGLSDPINMYYGVLNVLIAVMAAWLCRKKAFWRFPHILFAIMVFSLIGGAGGSILTWFLYGGGFGEGISSELAHYFYETSIHSVFWAQMLADTLIDLLDKSICVVFVSIVLLALPARIHKFYDYDGWRESYVGGDGKKSFKGGLSLQAKLVLLLSAAVCFSSGAVSIISIRQYHSSSIEENGQFALDLATYAANCIDGDKVDEYLERGEEAEGYIRTEALLQRLWDCSSNIQYIYAYKILEDGCHVVFDLDTPDMEGGNPGDIVEFDEAFSDYLPSLLAGEYIEPVVSNETFGWLLTAYMPVYNSDGECECYAAIDISMPELAKNERIYIVKLLSLFLGFFILILALIIYTARHDIVIPINSMAGAADAFAYNSEEAREDSIERIRNLDIRTRDEIENLYHAMVKTTEDTARYIDESQEKNETISKLQNGMIVIMADLVESRDKYTGTHVKNTAAYVRVIMKQMEEEGIYADQISDEYIQDVVDSAPLHDIGKIRIPDAILNKPGRLTEEEFARMKEHTTIGAEILEGAIETLSAGTVGYLKEAKNLAQSHHEKWNGTGYPEGLSGEDIPLSARVMAVADVFDALVSRRSYKEGMPVEKAMDIIIKDSGTHFDPKIVEAFVHCQAQIREIAESK